MKKQLLLATTLVSATCAKECQPKHFEFLAGLNTGFNIGKYGIRENDYNSYSKKDGETKTHHIWNSGSTSKSKFAPFIEGEVSVQYLTNNVFIGVNIVGV